MVVYTSPVECDMVNNGNSINVVTNTIELPEGNNVVPLRSDTIWLVQNGCSFHGLRSEDPNQHLKDFFKLVDSLDLDGENRERTRMRPTKLHNDILMFQQHHGESLFEAWTRFKDLLQKVPHHGIDLWLQVQIFYDHVNPVTRRTIDQSAGGKLRDLNAEESWALLEDLALYDNESWNDPRDFAKPDKEIAFGPHDTQYCMKDPEQAFVEFASSLPMKREVSGILSSLSTTILMTPIIHHEEVTQTLEGLVSNFMASQDARISKFEADFKQQQSEMTNKIDTVLKAITDRITGTLPRDTVKNPKLSTSPVFLLALYPIIDPQCTSLPSTSSILIESTFMEANISKNPTVIRKLENEPQQPKNPNQLFKMNFMISIL
ncbi:hypothetical protein Tco_0979843 [Tanacetum coccineum]